MLCPRCRRDIPDDSALCPYCGKRLRRPPVSAPVLIAAAVLVAAALFLWRWSNEAVTPPVLPESPSPAVSAHAPAATPSPAPPASPAPAETAPAPAVTSSPPPDTPAPTVPAPTPPPALEPTSEPTPEPAPASKFRTEDWAGTWYFAEEVTPYPEDNWFQFDFDRGRVFWNYNYGGYLAGQHAYPLRIVSGNTVEMSQDDDFDSMTDRFVLQPDGTLLRTMFSTGQTFLLTR